MPGLETVPRTGYIKALLFVYNTHVLRGFWSHRYTLCTPEATFLQHYWVFRIWNYYVVIQEAVFSNKYVIRKSQGSDQVRNIKKISLTLYPERKVVILKPVEISKWPTWGLSCRVKIAFMVIVKKLLVRFISNFDTRFYSRVLLKSKSTEF